MPQESTILALYLAHRGELVAYASRILGDRAEAEDVVQEAYLRLDAAAARRPLDEPVGYLYRIVRNLALDFRRHLTRDRERHARDVDGLASGLAADRPSPEAEALARDELRVVAEAMDELPARTRQALELHRFGGCTFKEIAERLGISVGLAHALVIQGLEHCRDRLFRK